MQIFHNVKLSTRLRRPNSCIWVNIQNRCEKLLNSEHTATLNGGNTSHLALPYPYHMYPCVTLSLIHALALPKKYRHIGHPYLEGSGGLGLLLLGGPLQLDLGVKLALGLKIHLRRKGECWKFALRFRNFNFRDRTSDVWSLLPFPPPSLNTLLLF